MIDQSIEQFIAMVQGFPWWGVLLLTFANSYIENIIPVAPSDVLLVFLGTMVGVGVIDFPSALVASTVGSSAGFVTMFLLGRSLDRRVVESGKYSFIPVQTIHTVEKWFRRYGYAVIIINRFLSGTRAAISALAGMSELDFTKSTIACTVSALVWNALILYAGMSVGKNWREVEVYLQSYARIITIITIIVAAAAVGWYLLKRFRKNGSGSTKEHEGH